MFKYLFLPEIIEYEKILDYTDNMVYTSILKSVSGKRARNEYKRLPGNTL